MKQFTNHKKMKIMYMVGVLTTIGLATLGLSNVSASTGTWGSTTVTTTTLSDVGIGTTTPEQKLHIGGLGGIGFGDYSSDKKLYSPTNGDLVWSTHDWSNGHGFAVAHQGDVRVYLNTNGNSYLTTDPAKDAYGNQIVSAKLGIGTKTPISGLQVAQGQGIALTAAYGKTDPGKLTFQFAAGGSEQNPIYWETGKIYSNYANNRRQLMLTSMDSNQSQIKMESDGSICIGTGCP
jgi:hypothetical protein